MLKKAICLSVFFLGIQSSIAQPHESIEGKSPNIVLFIVDDLGFNDIGPYGNEIVRTPNLDRLAENSVLFSEVFATSPTCSPSRASIHTGLYPFRNGAHANHTGVSDGIRTLPHYLIDLGYIAGFAGKYHIGPKNLYPYELIADTNVPEPGYEDRGVLWTDLNLDPVESWLEEKSNNKEPFFLVVNDHSPHVIWPENAQYIPEEIDIPEKHIDTKDTRDSRARYYTDITKMDHNVGRLMKSLEKYQLAENTMIIFTSDQGPQWAFGKWNLYDYGMKVPLIVYWPGTIENNSRSDALVSLADLLPTIIEIAGGTAPKAPEQIDGESFLPILLGKEKKHHEKIFGSHTGDGTMNRSPMRMVRTEQYKFIFNLAPENQYHTHMNRAKDHDGGREYWDSWVEKSFKTEHAGSVLWRYHNRPEEELYDIKKDPNEINNLAADPDYVEVLEKLRAELNQWRGRQNDFETGVPKNESQNNSEPVTPYIF